MDAPDASEIDLDPANIRCRADLVYRLRQLRTNAGGPSYRDLSLRSMSMGKKLPIATIGDLIGDDSLTSASKLTWKTVRLFVLACGVPETELAGWQKAWECTVASDKPTWQDEQQRLHAEIDQLTARIDQLTAALAAAETRAAKAEADLDAYNDPGKGVIYDSSWKDYPDSFDFLCMTAQAYSFMSHYVRSAKLYGKIAMGLEREYGPGNPRTLEVQRLQLDAQTQASLNRHSIWFAIRIRRNLKARWQHLICEHQRWLTEGNRVTLQLRLEYARRVANIPGLGDPQDPLFAHKLLLDLHADCKLFLPPDDDLIIEVASQLEFDEKKRDSHPGDELRTQ